MDDGEGVGGGFFLEVVFEGDEDSSVGVFILREIVVGEEEDGAG